MVTERDMGSYRTRERARERESERARVRKKGREEGGREGDRESLIEMESKDSHKAQLSREEEEEKREVRSGLPQQAPCTSGTRAAHAHTPTHAHTV